VPEEEAVGIGAAVLRRLWRPAPDEHSYRLLADETVRWAEQLPGQWEDLGRPVERSVVDQALAALRELPPTQEIAHALASDGLRNEGMTAAARFLAEV
jgi:hypothetical protein